MLSFLAGGANVLRVRSRSKLPGHVPRELEQILDNLELADQIPPHLLIGNSHCHHMGLLRGQIEQQD